MSVKICCRILIWICILHHFFTSSITLTPSLSGNNLPTYDFAKRNVLLCIFCLYSYFDCQRRVVSLLRITENRVPSTGVALTRDFSELSI